jgi:glutathione S-transferase
MILYHFPGCPYSERIEILLNFKGLANEIEDFEFDLSQPRPDWLLEKTGGSTALPVLDCGTFTLRESTVILRYLDARFPQHRLCHPDPERHGIESLLGLMGSSYAKAGYLLLRNRDQAIHEELRLAFDTQYAGIDAFLRQHGGDGPYLFDSFGWAEVMLTPLLKRLECLDYYDTYRIPEELDRVRKWHAACIGHPAAQSRTIEEIVKLYYDYSRGASSGSLVPGRRKSSFAIDPCWRSRPFPPRDKWGDGKTDLELGLE